MDFESLSMFWWTVAGVLFLLEIITPTTILIFPSIAAILIGFLALISDNIILQSILFFLLSGFFIALIKPFFVNNHKNIGYKQGNDAYIGQKMLVIQSIDHANNTGRVKYGSEMFPAKSIDNKVILENTWVKVCLVKGITMIVDLEKQ